MTPTSKVGRLINDCVNRVERRYRLTRLLSAPVELCIEPTNMCNSRCLMCLPYRRDDSVPHAPGGYLSMETLAACAPAMRLARRVLLGGFGEPLLHPRYLEMLEWVKARVPYVYFFTNGTLITPQLADGLVRTGVDAVVFSLGGATEETHQHIRGVSLVAMLEGLRNLTQARSGLGRASPKVSFNVVQMNSVLPEMKAIVDLARQYDVSRISMPQMWVESPEALVESVLGDAHAAHLLGQVEEYAQGHGIDLVVSDNPPRDKDCVGPWFDLVVAFNGDVFSCTAERYVLGNVNETPILQMWRSGAFRGLRRRLKGAPRDLCPYCPTIDKTAFANPARHGRHVSEPFDSTAGPARVHSERVCG